MDRDVINLDTCVSHGNRGNEYADGYPDMSAERRVGVLRHTDKNISDIAYDTGFANVTYFNRLFRNKYNRTPKSVRTEKQ